MLCSVNIISMMFSTYDIIDIFKCCCVLIALLVSSGNRILIFWKFYYKIGQQCSRIESCHKLSVSGDLFYINIIYFFHLHIYLLLLDTCDFAKYSVSILSTNTFRWMQNYNLYLHTCLFHSHNAMRRFWIDAACKNMQSFAALYMNFNMAHLFG